MSGIVGQVQSAIDMAVELICHTRAAVVLTGAGFSTASGIPDFRSERTGLWARDEPLQVASLDTFRGHPEQFFHWFQPLAGQIFAAQPNAAHLALAALEEAKIVSTIITQNIDMLHQKAGSQNVIEMHGTLATLTCTECFHKTGSAKFLPDYLASGRIPTCPICGGILKPDVILFGEQLPEKSWQQAQAACRGCDLLLVAGSSLEVLPVARLPMLALDRGAHVIIVNQAPTYLNVRADVAIMDDVASVMPAIAEQVLHA
jgi:NAD-dependent deacetylase